MTHWAEPSRILPPRNGSASPVRRSGRCYPVLTFPSMPWPSRRMSPSPPLCAGSSCSGERSPSWPPRLVSARQDKKHPVANESLYRNCQMSTGIVTETPVLLVFMILLSTEDYFWFCRDLFRRPLCAWPGPNPTSEERLSGRSSVSRRLKPRLRPPARRRPDRPCTEAGGR